MHPHVQDGRLWPGPCLSSWEHQTTAPGWGWSWENRSWACLGRLRLSGRSQACSVHQLLAAEGTSAWIPGTLVPSGIVALCMPLPRAGAVRAGHSCCLEDGVGALPRCLLGACSASHFPLSPPSDNVDDPTGNFRSGPLTGWRVFLLLLCALLGIIVCAVVGAVVFQKRQERNKRFY